MNFMNEPKSSTRDLRARIEGLLRSEEFEERLSEWPRFPARRVINPLFSFFYSPDELLKMRAVKAAGIVVTGAAKEDIEFARVVMRRLIWNLNDESGGIGWGSPEAMGEIMAMHERIAREYVHILVSYIDKKGNPLEHEGLEEGVLWGIGRLAQVRPHLLRGAGPHVIRYLASENPVLRGTAAWVIGMLKAGEARPALKNLLGDRAEVILFRHGSLDRCRVGELAKEALESLDRERRA